MRIAISLRLLFVLRHFDNASCNWLGLGLCKRQKKIADNARLWNEISFNDSNPWRPFDRTEVLCCRFQFVIAERLRQFDHRVRVWLSWIRAVAFAASEILYLLYEICGRKSCDPCILRPALSVRQMTRAASARRFAQTRRAMLHNVRH